jgi:hypothetical protein
MLIMNSCEVIVLKMLCAFSLSQYTETVRSCFARIESNHSSKALMIVFCTFQLGSKCT